MRKPGFSLIEIMVVIALLAIMTLIAVPTYENYYVKAQVSKGLDIVVEQLQRQHESRLANGSYPGSISFLGTSTSGTCTALPTNTFGATLVCYNAGTNFAFLQLYFTPAYLKLPSSGGNATWGYVVRAAILVDPTSGISRVICGPQVPGGDANDTPVKYLPTVCSCTDMAGAWTGTPSGC